MLRKKNPSRAPTIRNWTRLAPEKLRDRKTRSGRRGLAAVAWRTTNAVSRRMATVPKPIVCAEPQPYRGVSTMV